MWVGGCVRWEEVALGGGEVVVAVVAVYMCVCVIIRIMRPEFDGDRT